MTPFSSLVIFPSPDRWSRVRPSMLPIGPAGRILAPDDDLDISNSDLWVLFAGNEDLRYEMSRVQSFAELEGGSGLLMPAGRNLAGAWDRKKERFTSFSRPFSLKNRQTQLAPLEAPDDSASWLVVYLERPTSSTEDDLANLDIAAAQGEASVSPDEIVRTDWGIYAIWYDLLPGTALLTGGGDSLYAEPTTIQLEPGTIHRHDGVLVPRPSLAVHLILPTEVRALPARSPSPLRLRVLDPSGQVPAAGAGIYLWLGHHLLSGRYASKQP